MQDDACCRTLEEIRNDAGSYRSSGSQHGQSRPSSSSSKSTKAIAEVQEWNTIVEARVADCCNLSDQAMLPLRTEFGIESKSNIREFLWRHIEVLANAQQNAVERRKSYRKVRSFFERIDQAKQEAASAATTVQKENKFTGCRVSPENLHGGSPSCSVEKSVQGEQSVVVHKESEKNNGDGATEIMDHTIGINHSRVPVSLCNRGPDDNTASNACGSIQKDSPKTNADMLSHSVRHAEPNDIVVGLAYNFIDRHKGAYPLFGRLLDIHTLEFLQARTAEEKQEVCRKILRFKFRFLIQESLDSDRLVPMDFSRSLEFVEKALIWKSQNSSIAASCTNANARIQQHLDPLKETRAVQAISAPSHQSRLMIPSSQVRDYDVLLAKKHSTKGKTIFKEQFTLLRKKGISDLQSASHAAMVVRNFGGRFLKPVNQSNDLWEVMDRSALLKAIQNGAARHHNAPNAIRQLCRCTKRDVLLGKLDFADRWPANVELAKRLTRYSNELSYCPPNRQMERKIRIARHAVHAIVKNGGRFLQHSQGKTGTDTLVDESWLPVDPKIVEHTFCQLLPDCSTMTTHAYEKNGATGPGPGGTGEHANVRRTPEDGQQTDRHCFQSSIAQCDSTRQGLPTDAERMGNDSSLTQQDRNGPDTIDLTACESDEESEQQIAT